MPDKVTPCRVLVVDDDKLLRTLLIGVLENYGAEIVGEAANGDEAVQAFAKHKPDITFLDIEMPIKNGLSALVEILEIDREANVVMLTAINDMDVANTCIDAGARSYIRKGVSSSILNAMLKAELESLGYDG